MNLIGRAIPFLNKYLPSALAVKGLSKIDNKLGTFIQNAVASGYTTDSVLDFLRSSLQSPGDKREMQNLQSLSESGNIHPEQQRSLQNRQGQESVGKGISTLAGLAGGLAGLGGSEQEQQQQSGQGQQRQTPPPIPPKENRNIIEQYSPELHQFIDQEVKNGRDLLQAGALAQNDKRFSKIIDKLSKDHKTPWSNILQAVYGGAQQSQPQVQPQQSQQQSGQGQQALASILEKINQRLGQ